MKKRVCRRILAAFLVSVIILTKVTGNGSFVYAEEEAADFDADTNEPQTELGVVTVNGGAGSLYYRLDEMSDFQAVSGNTVSLQPGSYVLRYVADVERLLNIAGLEGTVSYAATGEAWQQQWEGNVTLAAGDSLNLNVLEAELLIQSENVIVPEFEYSLSVELYTDTGKPWGTDILKEFTFGCSESDVICSEQEKSWTLRYKKSSETALEKFEVTASNGNIILKKELSVAADSGVIYGTDFSVGSTEDMYAYTDQDGVLTIYHNGMVQMVNVLKNRYTDYRYRFNEAAYPADFTSFGERESSQSIMLTGEKLYLQMKNTDPSSPMFGSSGAVLIVKDQTAPVIDDDFVKIKQGFEVNSPYGTVYTPEAFNEMTLDFRVTEDNLLKIEIELGSPENVITLLPNTPAGNVYTYKDISLGEAAAFADGSIKITVYDKAMNTDVFIYPVDTKKVTYVNSPTILGVPIVKNELIVKSQKTFAVTKQGKMDMGVHIRSELLIPELLELRLVRVDTDGSRTEIASFRDVGEHAFTVSGSNGAWDISCSYTFHSADEGGYGIAVYYTDIAQNRILQSDSTILYYVDMTPVTLSAASDQVVSGGITNSAVKLTYTMVEAHPDFEQIVYEYNSVINSTDSHITEVTLVMPDGTKEAVAISELAARINHPSVWKQNQDVYTLTLIYAQESMYNTKLTVRDAMGSAASAQFAFCIDLTAPQVTSVDVKTDYEDKNNTDYSKFDAASAEVKVEVLEEIAQASEMEIICVAKDADSGEESFLSLTAPNQEGNKFTYTFTIERNFKGTISFTAKDAMNSADNMGVSFVNGIVVEDAVQHKLVSDCGITENGAANANGFYRRDISLKLWAQDTYSGIRSLEYSINGTKTTEDFSRAEVIRTVWEKLPVYVKAVKANEGNDIQVALTVTDNAGHKDTIEKTYKIDISKPVISVSYDNHSSLNETYYKENRTAVITIRELNYDSNNTTVTLYKNGAASVVPNTFRTDGTVKTEEDGTKYKEYVMRIPFEGEGDYSFQVETIDLAGNKAVYEEKTGFTIDLTPPKMEISYDNNASYQEQYFGEGRTASITVAERNFDLSGIEINITAVKDGIALEPPKVSSFTSDGDIHKAKVSFLEDADYTVSATCIDLAGNVGESIAEQQFTVDLTAPEIVITGVLEDVSYNESVLPVVSVTDSNYDMEGVKVEIIGGRRGLVEDIMPSISEIGDGQSYSYPDFKHLAAIDDCYIIKVTARDKAGHQSEADVNYRVNRFGSTYSMNSALMQMVERYYGHASDEYAIIETNVDRLLTYQVSYTLDNEIVNLTEGADYEVISSQTASMWQQYEYRLKASVFEREGIYSISVSSKDAAGNVTDNKAKGTILEFCIDNTSPSCIISGVSEEQRFEKVDQIAIGVEIYDNVKLEAVSVLLNGNEEYTEKDLVEGRITNIPINRSIKEQVLTVVCCDAAGNERIETIHFSCNVSAINMPAWAWMIIVPIGLILMFWFVLLMKRRAGRHSAL